MASKHPYPKYYTAMYMWMAHIISTLYAAFLQPLLNKKPIICQCRYKQYYPNAFYKQKPACSNKMAYKPKSPLAVPNCTRNLIKGHKRLYPLLTP